MNMMTEEIKEKGDGNGPNWYTEEPWSPREDEGEELAVHDKAHLYGQGAVDAARGIVKRLGKEKGETGEQSYMRHWVFGGLWYPMRRPEIDPGTPQKEKITWQMSSFFKEKEIAREETLQVELEDETIVELTPELHEIYEELNDSKEILQLKDDWDDQGSIHYEKDTWKRAAQFVANYAKWVLDRTSIRIPTPKIYPGPDGSIDIQWKSSDYRFLINIATDPKVEASFYGDNYDKEKISGTFDPEKFNLGLLLNLLRS